MPWTASQSRFNSSTTKAAALALYFETLAVLTLNRMVKDLVNKVLSFQSPYMDEVQQRVKKLSLLISALPAFNAICVTHLVLLCLLHPYPTTSALNLLPPS